MASFKGRQLFASGPHRMTIGERGEFVVSRFQLGSLESGSIPVGPLELDITFDGRLIASDIAGLQSVRDAFTDELTHPPETGTLTDTLGRAWSEMSLVSYEEIGPIARGRTVSIAYRARFRRFEAGAGPTGALR